MDAWWCRVRPTLSGDVISHAGVVLWNVIAHIADIWLIVWALWGEQVQSGVSQCSRVQHKLWSESHTHSYCSLPVANKLQQSSAICPTAVIIRWDTAAFSYFIYSKHNEAIDAAKEEHIVAMCSITVACCWWRFGQQCNTGLNGPAVGARGWGGWWISLVSNPSTWLNACLGSYNA